MRDSTKKVLTPLVIVGCLCLASACSGGGDSVGGQNNSNSPIKSSTGSAGASTGNSTGDAKNPVEQLITLCKDDNYQEAAKHMRYPGTDESKRDMTANYESDDAEEKRQIEMSCRRFRLMAGVSYTVSPERRQQGFYVYDVEIKAEGKTEKELWAFRKSGDDYVLVDID